MSQIKDISTELVEHVAKLARIKLTSDEVREYQGHMSKVLGHVRELESVPTENINPFYSPVREDRDYYQSGEFMREDQTSPSLEVSAILRNAPQSELNQFKVEAVLEES